ncbi:MAG: ATP-grasp domain-containing protein, partial [Planctomycetes bacterium]|nr:ATP-grasp domain-containing protein [Planctomycetota bacterium]
TQKAWGQVIASIQSEMQQVEGLYPRDVLDTTAFIVEQVIEGEEFAFDAYYNAQGDPVILNILHHVFPHEADVNDRVYLSSKQIIQDNLADFTSFLTQVGQLSQVTNFPVHVEIRRDRHGSLMPIEINPLRFGGWCTTADMAYFAYGYNPYVYCMKQLRPNWDELLKDKNDLIYSLIVLNNGTGIDGRDIQSFDYDQLLSTFEKPLELRKSDFKKHPHFGFLFAETRTDHIQEIETILNSDLTEFIRPSALQQLE